MAKMILNDCYLSVATIDLSNRVRSLTMELKGDVIDATTMSNTYKDKLAGFVDWKVTVEFAQDYAAANVDATLFPLVGTSCALVIRPDSAAKGAGNPEFTGNGILVEYSPIAGKVSELNATKCTFEGTATLSRGT